MLHKHSKTSILTIFHISPMTIWELTSKGNFTIDLMSIISFFSWRFIQWCCLVLLLELVFWCTEALMSKGQPLRRCGFSLGWGTSTLNEGKPSFSTSCEHLSDFKTLACRLKKALAACVPLLSNSCKVLHVCLTV